MKVKICGITNYEDAMLSYDLGADYIGFNFYKASKRYIKPEDALSIITRLPTDLQTVGIFVNHSKAQIIEIVNTTKLDILQFHGDETLVFTEQFALPCIKRITPSEFYLYDLERFNNLYAVLIDAQSEEYGGTGQLADLKFASVVAKQLPMFLAGGITDKNIFAMMNLIHPYAMDICSGVERVAGKKSEEKMMRLFNAVNDNSREIL